MKNYVIGLKYNISYGDLWNLINNTQLANVKIELSTNNGSTWSTIIASTLNTGNYNWTVSGSISNTCLLRISDPSDATNNGISSEFGITKTIPMKKRFDFSFKF